MFHRNCYQILLLNFSSSTETVSREDSLIDSAREAFFCAWGLNKNISQILATIDFSSREITGKSLSIWENFIGNINFGQKVI